MHAPIIEEDSDLLVSNEIEVELFLDLVGWGGAFITTLGGSALALVLHTRSV